MTEQPKKKLLPEQVVTNRLILRVPTLADAAAVNQAVQESFAELNRWMEWAAEPQTMEELETFCEESRQKWLEDREYPLLMILKEGGTVIGSCGYPNLDWEVPKFEIGYWCHSAYTGCGYVSEAAYGLARLAFDEFHAARVELRMDAQNERSWRVAERLGFELEAVIHADVRANSGELSDTRIYALTNASGLEAPSVSLEDQPR